MNDDNKSEKIEVDKDFLKKVLNQVDGLTIRVKNIEAMMETEKEVKALNIEKSKAVVITKPDIDIEVYFMENLPFSQVELMGANFQAEIEMILAKYKVRTLNLKFNRRIR